MGSVNGRENLRSICMRERMLDARILRFVTPVPIRYLPRTIASKGPVVGNRRYIDPTRWVIPIICPWCLERGNRCTPLSRFFSAARRLYALFVRPKAVRDTIDTSVCRLSSTRAVERDMSRSWHLHAPRDLRFAVRVYKQRNSLERVFVRARAIVG